MLRIVLLALALTAAGPAWSQATAPADLPAGSVVVHGNHLLVANGGLVCVYRLDDLPRLTLENAVEVPATLTAARRVLAAAPAGDPRTFAGRAPASPVSPGGQVRAAPAQAPPRQVAQAPARTSPPPQPAAPSRARSFAGPVAQAPPLAPRAATPRPAEPPRRQYAPPASAQPRSFAGRVPSISRPGVPPGVLVQPEPVQPSVSPPVSRSAGTAVMLPPTAVGKQALKRPVPPATFHGPVPPAPTQAPPRVGTRPTAFNTWLRDRNARPPAPRPGRDIIGNPIPSGATAFTPSRLTRVNPIFQRVERTLGTPRHRYAVLPRDRRYPGFFDENDGYRAYRRHRHHTVIVIDLFYPYYFSAPNWYAFYYPGYYPSCYSLWGWVPGWIYPARVYYQPYVYLYTPRTGRPVDEIGASRAIQDIRDAWLQGDMTTFADHLTNSQDIQVYFNNKYAYTTSSDDYYGMTADVLTTTDVVSMDFDRPVWISPDEVFYPGRQVFRDPDGTEHTLYISYRLRRLGGDWYISGFGSSDSPIQSPYRDYRE